MTAKQVMRMCNIIFIIVMYIHCIACLWYFIAVSDFEWIPTHYYADLELDVYSTSLTNKYWVSIYASVLMLTGNDLIPKGTF